MNINGTELAATKPLANVQENVTKNVTISLTQGQWIALYRRYKLREKFCEIGMDSPNLDDLVLFQIFKQLSP